MAATSTECVWVTFISILLFLFKYEARAASNKFQATSYDSVNDIALLCLDGFMSVYISKVQFADLPLTLYVQDEHRGYYQAIAIARECHYFLGESDTSIIFTVATHSCFVKKQNNITSLTLVIVTLADRGFEMIKSVPVICERKSQETNKMHYPPVPRQILCSKDGFNIIISQNATVPPLNLDAVWIPSSQSHNCRPIKKSKDTVAFHFPFTDCGTEAMVADGIISYWVNIELKQQPLNGSIFRDTPFHFALAQMTQVGIRLQEENSEHESALMSTGILRTEMRFAKDASYKTFYSSREPPTVTELGQPVYAEVFVPKHEDKDLVLLLDDCWATPTEDPQYPKQWNLLVNGCPFTGDYNRTVVLPVITSKERTYPSLHKWFVVKMFSFVKPPAFEKRVYFHCDIEICRRPGCLQSCSSGSRKLRRIPPDTGQRSLYSVVSGGPLIYLL